MRRYIRLSILLCTTLLLVNINAPVAGKGTGRDVVPAAVIAVTTVDDELNDDDDCSLREAIRAANTNTSVDRCGAGSNAGVDEISLPAGIYTLTLGPAGDDAALNGDLDVTNGASVQDLIITGSGAATTILQACPVHQKTTRCADTTGIEDRVLDIHGATVEIVDLTIRHGRWLATAEGGGGIRLRPGFLLLRGSVVADSIAARGGGIQGDAIAGEGVPAQVILQSTITGNVASDAGGGIHHDHGTITITDSTIASNETGSRGGGIETTGGAEATLRNTSLTGNRTGGSGGGLNTLGNTGAVSLIGGSVRGNTARSGGGINSLAHLSVVDTTIAGNTAAGSGGGIQHAGIDTSSLRVAGSSIITNTARDGGGIAVSRGTAVLTNTTISGNSAAVNGGGVSVTLLGHVAMNNVTVTGNMADSTADQVDGAGGGIAQRDSAEAVLGNTVVAGNEDRGGQAPDCVGTLDSAGHNLVGTLAGCGLTPAATDIAGVDALLAPLAENGGATQTHALNAASPAVDTGNPAQPGTGNGACEAADQRGVSRPAGAACDIGAFEGALQQVTILTRSPLSAQLGRFFSHQLQATGGRAPYAWSTSAGALPAGMTLRTDGTLSGTPTELGSFRFTVRVTDSTGTSADKTFVAEVSVSAPALIRIDKFSPRAVPGRVVDYYVLVTNSGTMTVTDYQVMEFLEPWFTFSAAEPTPLRVEQDTIVWDLAPLAPGAFTLIIYQVRLDADVPLGTTVRGPACAGAEHPMTEAARTIKACRDDCNEKCDELPPGAAKECKAACYQAVCETVARAEMALVAAGECTVYAQDAVGPIDPNEKGSIAQRFIQPDRTLVYPIHFENIGTIEARDVFVTDVIDPDLDVSTLEILSPGGSFDAPARTLRWELLGIDLPPAQGDTVLFAMKPRPNLPSGTEIRNRATIQFEVFEPITTNEVVNIIDTTPPACTMNPLPAVHLSSSLPLSWRSSDPIGEIDYHTILVSTNSGSFVPVLSRATGMSTSFETESGTTYGFICVATDTAGNTEVQTMVAEAVTTGPQRRYLPMMLTALP